MSHISKTEAIQENVMITDQKNPVVTMPKEMPIERLNEMVNVT